MATDRPRALLFSVSSEFSAAGMCLVAITKRNESRIFKAATQAWPASEALF